MTSGDSLQSPLFYAQIGNILSYFKFLLKYSYQKIEVWKMGLVILDKISIREGIYLC